MLQPAGWRRLFLCAVLEFAALTGAPLRPKDIEIALRPLNGHASQEQRSQEKDEPDPIPTAIPKSGV